MSGLPEPPGDLPRVSLDASAPQREWIPHRSDAARPPRLGCGFAVVLGVLALVGIVGIALAALAFRGDDEPIERSPSELVVGDCLLQPGGDSRYLFELVDCDRPHDDEVFAVGRLNVGGAAPYPPLSELQDRIEAICSGDAFTQYVGIESSRSSYRVLLITPDAEAWARTDGVYVCLIDGRGQALEGSARGTGR